MCLGKGTVRTYTLKGGIRVAEYVISTCSTADLPKNHFENRDIHYVCFHADLGGQEYLDDLGESIPLKDFYQEMREGVITKTSQVNTEEYIEQCINSLLSQTYTNIEIICVNDGSPDNCPKILDKYKQIDNRVVVHNQENKGQSVARNKGVELSTGNWITFVDSDDWVGVDCYQKFYEALNNSDYFDIFMFNGTCFTKDENNLTDLKLRDFFNLSQWNKKNGEICSFKDCKSPFEGNLSVYNKIYRREFIQRNNLLSIN